MTLDITVKIITIIIVTTLAVLATYKIVESLGKTCDFGFKENLKKLEDSACEPNVWSNEKTDKLDLGTCVEYAYYQQDKLVYKIKGESELKKWDPKICDDEKKVSYEGFDKSSGKPLATAEFSTVYDVSISMHKIVLKNCCIDCSCKEGNLCTKCADMKKNTECYFLPDSDLNNYGGRCFPANNIECNNGLDTAVPVPYTSINQHSKDTPIKNDDKKCSKAAYDICHLKNDDILSSGCIQDNSDGEYKCVNKCGTCSTIANYKSDYQNLFNIFGDYTSCFYNYCSSNQGSTDIPGLLDRTDCCQLIKTCSDYKTPELCDINQCINVDPGHSENECKWKFIEDKDGKQINGYCLTKCEYDFLNPENRYSIGYIQSKACSFKIDPTKTETELTEELNLPSCVKSISFDSANSELLINYEFTNGADKIKKTEKMSTFCSDSDTIPVTYDGFIGGKTTNDERIIIDFSNNYKLTISDHKVTLKDCCKDCSCDKNSCNNCKMFNYNCYYSEDASKCLSTESKMSCETSDVKPYPCANYCGNYCKATNSEDKFSLCSCGTNKECSVNCDCSTIKDCTSDEDPENCGCAKYNDPESCYANGCGLTNPNGKPVCIWANDNHCHYNQGNSISP